MYDKIHYNIKNKIKKKKKTQKQTHKGRWPLKTEGGPRARCLQARGGKPPPQARRGVDGASSRASRESMPPHLHFRLLDSRTVRGKISVC